MKKLLTLGLFVITILPSAIAQKSNFKSIKTGRAFTAPFQQAAKGTGQTSQVVFPASFGSSSPCLSNIYTYRDSTFGYFAGNNSYGDKELLMRYTLSQYGAALPATVDTAYVFFGAKYVGDNGMVYAKIYDADANGAPGNLLGTSAGISVSALDTNGNETRFVFPSPVSLTSGQFFVSVDVSALYTTGDTVGILSTNESCATTDATGAWTKEDDDNFYAFSDADHNWGFSIDMAIFARITANSLSVGNIKADVFPANVYPTPATGNVVVAFTGEDNGITTLSLKDITGKTISAGTVATTKENSYKIPFDVSMLSSGLYLIELSSATHRGVLKVSVKQ